MCLWSMKFQIFKQHYWCYAKLPTLTNSSWLCIDKLEEIVKQEGIEEVVIGNVIIMFLLYIDDVVLFANTLGDVQKLMRALEEFCM